MKKFPGLAFFTTWMLVFCGTLGAPLCLVTAYDLPCHLFALILAAFIISGFMTLLFTAPELGAYMLVPFGITLLLVNLFRWNRIYGGAVLAVRTIQRILSETLSFVPNPGAIPSWIGADGYPYFVGFFIGALMVVMALFISWGLVSGESLFLPLLVPLPMVALSLIYSEMQPAGWAGVLVCLYYGGVLFSGGLRLHHGSGIGRITGLALLSLLLGMLILVKALPPEEYEPRSDQDRMDQVARQAADVLEKLNRMLDVDIREREDLSREGELKSTDTHAMDVKTTRAGRLYLRGTSYGRYDGRYWTMTGEYDDTESVFLLGGSLTEPAAWLEVQNAESTLIYTPYAVMRDSVRGQIRENYIAANEKLAQYSWVYRSVPEGLKPRTGTPTEQAYAAWAKKTYVALSSAQQTAYLEFLRPFELPDADDPCALAQAIGAIVRSMAEYDMQPGKTPTDVDFVLHFLLVNKRGYCVHYASALTVLLQAKGVPARFVMGYALAVDQANEWLEVTDRDAHAWTEVYVDGWGWVPIEATGGDDPRFQLLEQAPEPSEGPKQETPAPTGVPEETAGPASPVFTPKPTPEPEEETPGPSDQPEDTPTPTNTPSPTPEPTPPPPTDTPTPEPEEPRVSVITPTPEAPAAQSQPDEDLGGHMGLWILWLLLALLVALYFLLRRQVYRNRTERMLRGDGRKAVLYSYGELQKLARLGAALPEEARALADEAAFSRHPMGEEQKQTMAGFVNAARRELEEKLPWYRRWYLKHVLWMW